MGNTLWDRLDRERVAVRLAVAGVVWTVVALGILITGLLSITLLGSAASERARDASIGRAEEEWRYQESAYSPAEHEARLAEIERIKTQPLPVAQTLGGSALFAALVIAPLFLIGDAFLQWQVGARVPRRGECPRTHHAVAQASVAAGLSMPPDLRIIDTGSVNGLYVRKRSKAGFILCLTSGVTVLSEDEQRAIVANLISRATAGGGRWLTSAAPVMAAGWSVMRDWEPIAFLVQRGKVDSVDMSHFLLRGMVWSLVLLLLTLKLVVDSIAIGLPPLIAPMVGVLILASLPAAAISVTLAQNREAELGDSEGLLLTKDPRGSLAALALAADRSTYIDVPCQYAHVCWAWPADYGSAAEAFAAFRRERMRVLCGALGAEPS